MMEAQKDNTILRDKGFEMIHEFVRRVMEPQAQQKRWILWCQPPATPADSSGWLSRQRTMQNLGLHWTWNLLYSDCGAKRKMRHQINQLRGILGARLCQKFLFLDKCGKSPHQAKVKVVEALSRNALI